MPLNGTDLVSICVNKGYILTPIAHFDGCLMGSSVLRANMSKVIQFCDNINHGESYGYITPKRSLAA